MREGTGLRAASLASTFSGLPALSSLILINPYSFTESTSSEPSESTETRATTRSEESGSGEATEFRSRSRSSRTTSTTPGTSSTTPTPTTRSSSTSNYYPRLSLCLPTKSLSASLQRDSVCLPVPPFLHLLATGLDSRRTFLSPTASLPETLDTSSETNQRRSYPEFYLGGSEKNISR